MTRSMLDMWIYELASILCKLPSEEFAASFSCRILKEVKGCALPSMSEPPTSIATRVARAWACSITWVTIDDCKPPVSR